MSASSKQIKTLLPFTNPVALFLLETIFEKKAVENVLDTIWYCYRV